MTRARSLSLLLPLLVGRAYDLVVVRDLVFHLPQWEVKQILTHLSRSGTKYIMISHNPYQVCACLCFVECGRERMRQRDCGL